MLDNTDAVIAALRTYLELERVFPRQTQRVCPLTTLNTPSAERALPANSPLRDVQTGVPAFGVVKGL